MKQINWDEVLIRCSMLGVLFIEPKTKDAKLSGELSETAKTYLKQIYIEEKYGRRKEIVTKPMERGIECEDDSIKMKSQYENKPYTKNESRFSNEYVTGHPDIIDGAFVSDIKTCESIWTFHDKLDEPLPKLYYAQLQSYMWLTWAKSADITYCLPDSNEAMILDAQFKELKYGKYISEESPEFRLECAKIEKNMVYQDIPLEEKILVVKVERDEEFIAQIPSKVTKAREYLKEYEQKHLTFNKKTI